MQDTNLQQFKPELSGQINRNFSRQNIRPNESSALDQTLGVKQTKTTENANSKFYQGQVDFPQPSIFGFGKVTSSGAKGLPFFSDRWSVIRNSTGIYTITHNIGNTLYVPFIQAVETVGNARTCTISSLTENTMVIRTFNSSGTATDTDFHFIVFIQ